MELAWPCPLMLLRSLMLPRPVIPPTAPAPARGYDMDAAFMLFQRHEGGIHVV